MDTYFVNMDYSCDCAKHTSQEPYYYNLITSSWGKLWGNLRLEKGDMLYKHNGALPYQLCKAPANLLGKDFIYIEFGDCLYLAEDDHGSWFNELILNNVIMLMHNPEYKPKQELIKLDDEFPHVCPYCAGPAYLGGNNNVDCKNKCLKD